MFSFSVFNIPICLSLFPQFPRDLWHQRNETTDIAIPSFPFIGCIQGMSQPTYVFYRKCRMLVPLNSVFHYSLYLNVIILCIRSLWLVCLCLIQKSYLLLTQSYLFPLIISYEEPHKKTFRISHINYLYRVTFILCLIFVPSY